MAGKASLRRTNDLYETPRWMVDHLLDAFEDSGIDIEGMRALEPCVGLGNIVRAVQERAACLWLTNDIDRRFSAEFHLDASKDGGIWAMAERQDVIISNPPFTLASKIVPRCLECAPVAAMLLRLSWLEPTADRAFFLRQHPPDSLINMERFSFLGNGKEDSVTTAWFVWGATLTPAIQVRHGRGRQPELATYGAQIVPQRERVPA